MGNEIRTVFFYIQIKKSIQASKVDIKPITYYTLH